MISSSWFFNRTRQQRWLAVDANRSPWGGFLISSALSPALGSIAGTLRETSGRYKGEVFAVRNVNDFILINFKPICGFYTRCAFRYDNQLSIFYGNVLSVDLISDVLPFGRPCYHEPENTR
jgi:hypothetical protein